MRNLAAVICLSVCAVSVGINTAEHKYILAVVYGAAGVFFWNAISEPKR